MTSGWQYAQALDQVAPPILGAAIRQMTKVADSEKSILRIEGIRRD
jgi:hypothetical protein